MVADSSSNSNFSEATIRHIHLDWHLDFDSKVIGGSALLEVEIVGQSTSQIILDGSALDISTVSINNSECKFVVENVGVFGQRIVISLGSGGLLEKGSKINLLIHYKTTSKCSALQFVDAKLTADKKQPFMYSQCQPIHCRSIVPCMDSPSVKQTYSAKVTAPNGITVLMSGIGDISPTTEDAEHGRTSYSFRQSIPIPSYLIAIVAGALEKRDISHRCAIWSEPSLIEQARWEMEDTEKMLQTAEDLLGKYVWGRYDMVVLPPFFAFGGMENPCLTFLTPTIIVGDRSSTNVIAHEIAHSWTGNLVTNANWEQFWLNEGFTVFAERKIMGRLYGESIRQFESLVGWEDKLQPTVNEVFHPAHNFTKLIPDLNGCDPDEAFSTVPYEKGSAFLLHLEQRLGNVERFNEFLRAYIAKFAYKSVVTDDWKTFLYTFFADQKEVLDSIDFDSWLNKPGLPPNKPEYDESLVNKCRELANTWLNADEEEVKKLGKKEFCQMEAAQKCKVLECILAGDPLSLKRVELMERLYSLNGTGNCEVLKPWILIAIKAKWTPIIEPALEFVTRQGRGKFIKPVYKKLFAWEESRQRALDTFEKNTPFMHPITVSMVKMQLGS